MKDGCLIGILAVIMLITVVMIMNSNSDFLSIPGFNKMKYITRHHDKLVQTLVHQKYAVVDHDNCHVFIDQELWSECGYSERKDIAIAFAEYARNKSHRRTPDTHIEVYDKQSKKQIASWHSKQGFIELAP